MCIKYYLKLITGLDLLKSSLVSRLHPESDDEYSDDDDMSWKVRRSSIKCLEALIHTRRDLLLSFYSSICPALLARFKEREENVRADVFAAFSALLRETRVRSSHRGLIGPDSGGSREEEPAVAKLKEQVESKVNVFILVRDKEEQAALCETNSIIWTHIHVTVETWLVLVLCLCRCQR